MTYPKDEFAGAAEHHPTQPEPPTTQPELNRRVLLACGATATTMLVTPALGSESNGPVERLWREHIHRERSIITKKVRDTGEDLSDEDNEWSLSPLWEASTMRPVTEQKWAAMALMALCFSQFRDSTCFDNMLDMVEGVLGEDAGIEFACY